MTGDSGEGFTGICRWKNVFALYLTSVLLLCRVLLSFFSHSTLCIPLLLHSSLCGKKLCTPFLFLFTSCPPPVLCLYSYVNICSHYSLLCTLLSFLFELPISPAHFYALLFCSLTILLFTSSFTVTSTFTFHFRGHFSEGGQSLVDFQKRIEGAANSFNHSATAMRRNAEKKIPDEVTNGEKAAERSETPIERKVLSKRARRARARHAVQCSQIRGKRISKGRPLTELYVDGKFTEDTTIWKEELKRHCE